MRTIVSVLFIAFLAACSKGDKDTLKVGVTNGPHAKIAEFVQKKADKEGLKVQLVYFDDFIQPNVALDAGDIDMNIYQHDPFLQDQMKARGYKFRSVGKTVMMPLAIYPHPSIKSFEDVKDGAKILIPIDPTNSARALKLLDRAGLIELTNHINPTPRDLAQNPHNYKIIEVEAPLLPRLLVDDAELAVINADWVLVSQLDPHTALMKESAGTNYTNLIVIREGDQNRPEIQKFVKLYQAKDVEEFVRTEFKGVVDPEW